ncbi:MAG: hypothetical protein ACFB2Z_10015 [Maricaulaceae bacterium]
MLAGLLLLPLPIPLGLPLILLGGFLLVQTSNTARQALLRFLRRHPKIVKWLRRVIGRRRSQRLTSAMYRAPAE